MLDSYEKIKIFVTPELKMILIKDAELFEFKKNDNTANLNKFLNVLITNYFDEFSKNEAEKFNKINTLIEKYSIKGDLEPFIYDSLRIIDSKFKKEDKYSTYLSFRPNKDSVYLVNYIENKLLKNSSISDYFRNLFLSYVSMPQFKRERIICKETLAKVEEAIKDSKKVILCTEYNKDDREKLSPYSIAIIKDETFNYILCKNGHGAIQSFRLSKVKDCLVTKETTSFTEEEIALCKKITKYGAQYVYYPNEQETIIEFTKRGLKLFDRMYVYRPIPDKIEGNIMYFNCSYEQLYQYFSRFGGEIRVIKPNFLRKKLLKYHKDAYKKMVYKAEKMDK